MIDGVKCSCVGLDAFVWQNNPLLDFGLWVSEATGEVRTKQRTTKYQSLTFTLSDNGACSFAGSLHKYHNANDTNYNDFSFTDLVSTLHSLNNQFNIDLHRAIIHSIEIGVNIELDYSPAVILKSIICHKNKPFNHLDLKDKRVGLVCNYSDYSIKIYDKGHQSRISDNSKYIIRFEVKLHRQRMLLPFGIASLSDLLHVEKVAPLLGLLIEKIQDIVFFDFKYKGVELSDTKRLQWQQYSNPNYWADLSKKQRYKARQRYSLLIEKYGCIDWVKYCINRTAKKWHELAGIKQKTGGLFPSLCGDSVSTEKGTFSNLEYVLEKVACDLKERHKKKNTKTDHCYCVSCGRQLTGQKKGSLFCSEKMYGKEAKKCRNKESNRRLSIKRKINRAMKNDLLLKITYTHNGSTYTDIPRIKEISVTREWLDKVQSVEVMDKEPQPPLKGNKAKEYLQDINEKEINNLRTNRK